MPKNNMRFYSIIYIFLGSLFLTCNSYAQKSVFISVKEPIQYIEEVIEEKDNIWILGVYRMPNTPPTPAVWLLDAEQNLKKVIDQKDVPGFRGIFQNIMVTEETIVLGTLDGLLCVFDRNDYTFKQKIKIQYRNTEIVPLAAGQSETFYQIGDYFLISAMNRAKVWPDPACFKETDFALAIFDQEGKYVQSMGGYPKAYTTNYLAHNKNFLIAQTISQKRLLIYRHTNQWIEILSTDNFKAIEQVKIPIFKELSDQLKTVGPDFKDKPFNLERSRLAFEAQAPFIGNLDLENDLISFLFYTPIPSERSNQIELVQYSIKAKKQTRKNLGKYKYNLHTFKYNNQYAGLRFDRKSQQLILLKSLGIQ
jgi:hypothetical protein